MIYLYILFLITFVFVSCFYLTFIIVNSFIFSRTDWLYSQKYDRQHASIKRSIERSASQPIGGKTDESAA